MFSRFFGKSDKVDDSQTKDLPIQRRAHLPLNLPAVAPPPQTQPETTVDFFPITERMPLEDTLLTSEQRKQDALDTVGQHHERIANTILTLWGYKECSAYINRLIMEGGDGMGHARVGFKQDAVQAMLELSDLHDAEFGPPDSIAGGLGLKI